MEKKIHPLARLAKTSVENYVSQHKMIKPEELTAEMKEKAGVFVCIKNHGQLRGCIGTLMLPRKSFIMPSAQPWVTRAFRRLEFPS